MKVYSLPDELPWDPDYTNYDPDKHEKDEQEHRAKLVQWLQDSGYNGPNTGKEYKTPKADGYARYMVADRGPRGIGTILIHLPYGDGWHDDHVQYLPKKVIMDGVRHWENLKSIFDR